MPLRALLFGLGLAAAALPRPLELRLGRLFGRACLALGLFKHRVASQNIARCLPDLDEAQRRRLLEANFEHYGVLFFEFLHFFSPIPNHFTRYSRKVSRLEGLEHWHSAAAKGKGAVFFAAHLGFWEMSGAATGLAALAPTIVTTVIKPRWLHERINSCRAANGVASAFHPGSMPAVLRTLRRGGAVGFMNDQYAPPPMGLPVLFFGVRVDTLAVVSTLARRTGAAVLPTLSYREPGGVTVVRIEPPMEEAAFQGDAAAATQAVATRVESWVRRYPEQWLWIHRRFKNLKDEAAVYA